MRQLPQIKIKGTLADRTYDILKKAIIELELMPGESITEETLSKQLGVSRTPIRDALSRLSRESLVEINQGKGSWVAELTEREVRNLFHVRRALERLSVQLAIENLGADTISNLTEILELQKEDCVGEYRDSRRFSASDVQFHMAIAEIAQNEYLESELKLILDNCSRYTIAFSNKVLPVSSFSYNDHLELLGFMKKRDVAGSEKVMLSHINRIEDYILRELKMREDEKEKETAKRALEGRLRP